MTLRFFNKQGKLDTRQIDYEQAMVKLGLEKAGLEKEVGAIRTDIEILGKRRGDLELEVQGKVREIVENDRKVQVVREQIADAFRKGTLDVHKLDQEKETIEKISLEKKEQFDSLVRHLESLNNDIDEKNSKLAELQKEIAKVHEEFSAVRSELLHGRRELEELQTDIKELVHLKVKITGELTSADIERQEVEDIVKMLKESNKEGLELVASFEGERKRLQEKDDFLRRKEADLLVYENRLKKRMEEAGYDAKMTFK